MSVSKLSQTLQQKIMASLVANIEKDVASAQALLPGKRFGNTFIRTVVTSSNATRLLTDPNQTGIFGKQGLQEIAAGFSKISQGLSKVGTRVIGKDGTISKQAGYKDLKEYLKKYLNATAGSNLSEIDRLNNAVKDLAKQADSRLSDPSLYGNFLEFVSREQGQVETLSSEVFAIRNTQHATINKLFEKYLLSTGTDKPLVDFISANTDAGHLLGIFNQKLFRAFGAVADNSYSLGELSVDIFANIDKNQAEDTEAIQKLNSTFSAAFNILEYLDILSSSLKTTPDIFVKLSKEVYIDPKNPKASAEIQLALDNTAIGNLITNAGKKLEALIASSTSAKFITLPNSTTQVRDPKSAEFAKQLEAIFKDLGNLASVAKQLAAGLQTAENKILDEYAKKIIAQSSVFGNILLNAEGSDSVKTAIAKRLASIISGKSLPSPSNSEVSAKKPTVAKKPKTSVAKPKLTAPKQKTSSTDISANKSVRRKVRTDSAINLDKLLLIINQQLQDVISANMGSGSDRNVLNYRTGRLAASAKVESLSESRAGMITAFYTYMKNPYATFSQGGQQSNPTSRDPKLLISRSIREIAQTQVSNTLRAVSI